MLPLSSDLPGTQKGEEQDVDLRSSHFFYESLEGGLFGKKMNTECDN